MFRLRLAPLVGRKTVEGGGERLPDHLKPGWNRVAGGVIDNPEVIIIRVRPGLRHIGDLVEAQELAKRDLFARILLFEPRFGDMVVFPNYHDGLSCVAGIGEDVVRGFLGAAGEVSFLSSSSSSCSRPYKSTTGTFQLCADGVIVSIVWYRDARKAAGFPPAANRTAWRLVRETDGREPVRAVHQDRTAHYD